MKPGAVVTIRINPRDCMAVIDVINTIGMSVRGMSFSQAVAVTLSSVLESLRESNHIPQREGFEYIDMMAPFADKVSRSRKLDINNTMALHNSAHQVPPMTAMIRNKKTGAKVWWERRMKELYAKKEIDPDNWSVQEQEELQDILAKLAGDPIDDEPPPPAP